MAHCVVIHPAFSQTGTSRTGVLRHTPPSQLKSLSSEKIAATKAKISLETFHSNFEYFYLENLEQELKIQEETGLASDKPRFSHPFVNSVTIVHEYAGQQIESPLVEASPLGERGFFERNVSQNVLKILIQFNKEAFEQDQTSETPEAFIFPGFSKLHANNREPNSTTTLPKDLFKIFKQKGKNSFALMDNFKLEWDEEDKLLAALPGASDSTTTPQTQTLKPGNYIASVHIGDSSFYAPFSVSTTAPEKALHELSPLYFRIDMEGFINKLNEEWGLIPDTAVRRAIQEQYAKKNGKEALAKALKDGSLQLPDSFFKTFYNPIKEHHGKIYFYFASTFPHNLMAGEEYRNRTSTLGSTVKINTGFLRKTPKEFVDYWKKFGQNLSYIGDPKKGEVKNILPGSENVYLSQYYSLTPQPREGANHLNESFEIHQLIKVKDVPQDPFLEKIKAHNIDPRAINLEGDILDLSFPVEFAGVPFKFAYQSTSQNPQCLDKYRLSDVQELEAVLGGRDKTDFGCRGCNVKGVVEVERDPEDFDTLLDARGSVAYKDKRTGKFYELRKEVNEGINEEGPYSVTKHYLWDTDLKVDNDPTRRQYLDPSDEGAEPGELVKKIFGKTSIPYELKIDPTSLKVIVKDGKKMLQLSGPYNGPNDKGATCKQTAIYRTEPLTDDKLQFVAHWNLPNLTLTAGRVEIEPHLTIFGGPEDTQNPLSVNVNLSFNNLLAELKKTVTADEAIQIMDQNYMPSIVVPFLGSFHWNRRFNDFKNMILAYEQEHDVDFSKIEKIELTKEEKRILGEIFFVTPEEFKKSGEEGKLFLKRVTYFMRENQETAWKPLVFVHKHFERHYQAFKRGQFFSADGLREIVLLTYMEFVNYAWQTAQNEKTENFATQYTASILEGADRIMETSFGQWPAEANLVTDLGYAAYDTYLLMRYLTTYLFVQPFHHISNSALKQRQLMLEMQNPFKTKEEVYAEMAFETLGLALDASIVLPMAGAMVRYSSGPLLSLARGAVLNNVTRTVGGKIVVDVPRYVVGRMTAAGTRVVPFVRRIPRNVRRIPSTLTSRMRARQQIRDMSRKVAQQLAARTAAALAKIQSSHTILKAWRSIYKMRVVVMRRTVMEEGLSEARRALRAIRKGTSRDVALIWNDIKTREFMNKLLDSHLRSNPETKSLELIAKLKELHFLSGRNSVPADIMGLARKGRWPELIGRLEATGVISTASRLRYMMNLGKELNLADSLVRYLQEIRPLITKKLYASNPHGEVPAILKALDRDLMFLVPSHQSHSLISYLESMHPAKKFDYLTNLDLKFMLETAFYKTGLISERNGILSLAEGPFFRNLFENPQLLKLNPAAAKAILSEEGGEVLIKEFEYLVSNNYLKPIAQIDSSLAIRGEHAMLPDILAGESLPTFGEPFFKDLVNSILPSYFP